jgi:hypothetical protein
MWLRGIFFLAILCEDFVKKKRLVYDRMTDVHKIWMPTGTPYLPKEMMSWREGSSKRCLKVVPFLV